MNFSDSETATLREIASLFGCELSEMEGGQRLEIPVARRFSLLALKTYQSKDKTVFLPVLPPSIQSTGDYPRIMVSLTRSASAIYNDLQRRMIPGALQWVELGRDRTAKLMRGTRERDRFIRRIFTANRCEPEHRSMQGGWIGNGFQIGEYDTAPNHRGEYVATVRVRTLDALEEIAAVCADDYEDHLHTAGKEASNDA